MFGKCVETGPNLNEPEELDFFKLVPPWAWILGAGVAGVVALSFLASMVIKDRAGLRLLCALAQFSLGAIAASIAHFSAYLTAAVDSDRYFSVRLHHEAGGNLEYGCENSAESRLALLVSRLGCDCLGVCAAGDRWHSLLVDV